jgi:endonuclease YncB( thermonuclease family)
MSNTTIEKIKKLLADIDDSLEDDDKIIMVRNLWEVGRLATGHKDATGKLLREIASDLDIAPWALQRYTQFYRSFSKGYPQRYQNQVITWSMFCAVLPVHDAKARDFYLQEACRQRWDKYALRKRIQEDYYGIRQDAAVSAASKALKVKPQKLYTYAGDVIKIVDADTFDLEIDIGFKTKQEHRVRLRGINAPEISTPQGRRAKRFVEKELKQCVVERPRAKGARARRPLAVVKTYKQGMYGRYIVDLYYLPKETDAEIIAEKGKLLNQVLVDQGLARKVE